ncbi:hypothetical protein SVI_0186 [Shewanella violacea DSS12]|uniref:Uncharacterized protein n=1 Tax=Shewanella violacea (strain JCM 10179 / CIP 106290 / LMG 19151 / DSS12) TaxID=637905 RepID=D4ZEC7_SHEVD|nr:hypothetical protein SVI_0186 [Shewanella violacea DSS12]
MINIASEQIADAALVAHRYVFLRRERLVIIFSLVFSDDI